MCPIPFTVLGLAAVLTVGQSTNSKAPSVVVSSLPLLLTPRSIRSPWHIQFTLLRYVHEINFIHI